MSFTDPICRLDKEIFPAVDSKICLVRLFVTKILQESLPTLDSSVPVQRVLGSEIRDLVEEMRGMTGSEEIEHLQFRKKFDTVLELWQYVINSPTSRTSVVDESVHTVYH